MKKLILLLSLALSSAPSFAQSLFPAPQSSTTSTQPTITAAFPSEARRARIWVDGTEFTTYLQTRGNVVALVPPYNLDYGAHQVQVRTADGRQAQWSFSIVKANGTAYSPGNSDRYSLQSNSDY